MSDMMTFPATVEEFMEQYKIVDDEKVYTNGADLVPIFRMMQWFEHVSATDTISRQAIDKFIDGLEEIFADLRERHVDDSVCGLCEYDGAYVGQSGEWCNECPGFDRDDCFKLSDKTRKEWTEEIIKALTPIQPDNNSEKSNSSDTISRQAAIDALKNDMASLDNIIKGMSGYDVRLDAYVSQRNQVNCDIDTINNLPPVQPEELDTLIKALEAEHKKLLEMQKALKNVPDTNVGDTKIIYCKDCIYKRVCKWKRNGATYCSLAERIPDERAD